MQFSTYSFILAISVILSLGAGYYTWKRRASADSLYLFFVIASAGIWSFFGLLASMATTVEAKIFYSQWQYFGISTVAVFFFLFTLKFTNKLPRLEPIHYLALFFIPILTVFAAFTNDFHHLLWREVSLSYTSFTRVTGYYVPGVVFWGILAYNYLMIVLSVITLVNESIKYPQHYMAQVVIIIISITLPLIGNIVYSFRRADVKGVDFTSVAISLGGFLMLLGLSRYKLLNVKPLARDFLFNSMQDGVIFLDAFNRIIDINKSAQATFGIDEKRLSVRRMENVKGTNQEIDQICSLPANSRTEFNFPLGSSSYFDVSAHPLFDPRGIEVGRVIIMHDISELKQSQITIRKQNQELELLNRHKDRMFSIVSHDLKSPLASIVNVAEMLGENSFRFTDAEKEKIIGNFLARARITLEMIENVLQWARLQNYGFNEELHEIDVLSTIRGVEQVYRYMADDKSIRIDIVPKAQAQPPILANEQLLGAVLRNLFTNAIKFTPRGGRIMVRYDYLREACQVCVADTGVGIAPEVVRTLFSNPQAGRRTGTRGETGSGLGLLLCKEFVERMHGHIWIESRVGVGTNVFFTLPYAPGVAG